MFGTGAAVPMGATLGAIAPDMPPPNRHVGEGGVPSALSALYEAIIKSEELLTSALNQLRGPMPEEAPRGGPGNGPMNIMTALAEIVERARRVSGKAHEINQRLL